jgi:type I restriction enzyme, S subunit
VVPRLRFPEFREVVGWDVAPMGSSFSLEYGASLPEQGRRPGLVPVMGSNGVVGYHDEALVKGPTIVVGRKGSVGQLNWVESDCFPIDTTYYVEIKQPSSTSMQFLYRLLQTSKLNQRSDSSAVPGLNRSAVHSVEVAMPGPAEQQKIADCLLSLDEVIDAQGRQVEVLRTHRRGLMQQLFPREGESLPHLRFPDFRADNRFEFKPIGKFAKVTTGDQDTQNRIDDGTYPFFVRSQQVERIDSFSYDGEAVLTSGDGVGVGENYHYINGKFAFHQRVYCIYCFDEDVSGQFFFYFFSSRFRKRVKQMSAKNSVDSVRMAMVADMEIWLPAIEEQQQIAGCLSTLDALIVAEIAKLDALKTLKTGLMQQLFPSSEKA